MLVLIASGAVQLFSNGICRLDEYDLPDLSDFDGDEDAAPSGRRPMSSGLRLMKIKSGIESRME